MVNSVNENYLAFDFGTSNSVAGAYVNGKKIFDIPLDPVAPDATLMRTLLYFPNSSLCYYGSEAIQKYIENDMQGRLFRSFKSHLPNQEYMGTFISDRVVTLENMVGIFLLEMKKRAEKHLGVQFDQLICGRPARYSMDPVMDGFALHRMEKAIQFAGFKKYFFVAEPLAAAFDFKTSLKTEKTVLVGDFGGGTSDFTLIRLRPDTFTKEDVLSIEGCPLAGDSLDALFMQNKLCHFFGAKTKYRVLFGANVLTMPPHIMQRLNQPAHIVHLSEKETYEFIKRVEKGAVTPEDKKCLDRLLVLIDDQQIFPFFEAIELVKRQLSDNNDTKFVFDYPDIEIEQDFSKRDFQEWATPNKDKIFQALDRCLAQAGKNPEDVDLICLTGGTAKVPFIKEQFEQRFGAEKIQSTSHFHSVLRGLVEAAERLAHNESSI